MRKKFSCVGCAVLLLIACAAHAQQASSNAKIAAESEERRYDENSLSPVLQGTAKSGAAPSAESPKSPWRYTFVGSYDAPRVDPLNLGNTARIDSLIANGRLYLSLHDAILLAIENNLDVEQQRYQLAIAHTDVIRAKGGGVVRGLPLTVAQAPVGIGGPGSPLLNNAAAAGAVSPTASTVSNVFDVNQLTEAQTSLSVQSPIPFSPGPPVPSYDPILSGQLAWVQIHPPELTGSASPPNTNFKVTNSTLANLALTQGIGTGMTISAGANNTSSILSSNTSQADPFRQPNVTLTSVQPLLRGAGWRLNHRYITIAENNLKVSRYIFRQQLTELIFGISRLYYDLVSLAEDVKVKQDTLAAAQKLYEDDKLQVEVGTLAPLELTRVQALVSSSELDLTRAQGLVQQQEAVLKSVISRRGTAVTELQSARIVPTDQIVVPETDSYPPLTQLIDQGLSNRADLAQAALQVKNGRLTVGASRNGARPELDLFGTAQTRGSLGSSAIAAASSVPIPSAATSTKTLKLYEAGIQLNLPFRNRVALADAARDELQLRQMEARFQQLENQVRDEIENASTALSVARAAYKAAVQSRQYQEQLLDAERQKLSVGASVNFFIVQDQSFLAQARSTEVVARSAYIKSRIALERALGSLLEDSNIRFEDAVKGEVPETSKPATTP